MGKAKSVHQKLGQFSSTSICGNDILSSALYVSGITAVIAGIYAPFVLLAVVFVLFLYKSVYREVVEALPINGGAYNALLNGTSKTVAAVAGVMTILSYIATAVISGKTAVEYFFKFLEKFLPESIHLNSFVIPVTIVILFGFALLVISGVKDSAKVASAIFLLHIISLSIFVIFGMYVILAGGNIFDINILETQKLIFNNNGFVTTMFLAFSASLLGVSGFESSANFVEEQAPGVFKKTLRNMLIGVAIFNPLISFVMLRLATIPEIALAKDYILADIAFKIGGIGLMGIISIDALLVLSGAVLTSYIGVSGLIKRLALDECLPSILLKENSKRSYPMIILVFFGLCTSIILITKGELLSLAGVYTISFLGVMTMFALGNLILRKNRPTLKRTYHAPILFVIVAALATFVGMLGNLAINPQNGLFFIVYFIPAICIVMAMIYRADVFKYLMHLSKLIHPLHQFFLGMYERALNPRYYIFMNHSNRLFEALTYIHENETGRHVRVVHCKSDDKTEHENFRQVIPALVKAGVYSDFKIDLDYMPEEFGPEAIEHYAKKRRINKNRIFIGSIHHHHLFDYEQLGGVRIISA